MLNLDRQNQYRERYRQMQPGWQPSGERYEARVRAHMQPASTLLDLGCGRGGLIEKLGPLVAQPLGLDPDWQSLAEHRSPATWRICAGAEGLPLAANSVDLIMASWLLEHLAEPDVVLAEVQRVLKPGGRFVTITPNSWHPIVVANRLSQIAPQLQRAIVPRLYGRSEADTFRVYYRANAMPRLRHLARRAGLQLAQVHPIADPTYLAFNDLFFRLATLAEHLLPAALKVHLVIEFEKPNENG